MFGPGMIRALNAAATVRGLMERDENFVYTADEIATEVAYEFGWRQDDQGRWFDPDDDGDETENPLDALLYMQLADDMQDEIVDRCVKAFNEEQEVTT